MDPEITLLNVAAVCARCGIARPSLYRMLKAGRFPQPSYPGGLKHPRWRSDDVAAWIERETTPDAA